MWICFHFCRQFTSSLQHLARLQLLPFVRDSPLSETKPARSLSGLFWRPRSFFFLEGRTRPAAFALILLRLRVLSTFSLVTRERQASACRLKLLIICPPRHFRNKLGCHVSCFNYSLPFRSGLGLAVLLDFTLSNNNSLSVTYTYFYPHRQQLKWVFVSVTTRQYRVRHLSDFHGVCCKNS